MSMNWDKHPMDGEPRFTLMARDPDFYRLVVEWATRRSLDIACGLRPMTDNKVVQATLQLAVDGAEWRRANDGKWRQP